MSLSLNNREAAYAIEPLFLARWSPRAFAPESIPEHELMTIFEAARWAPSSFNAQPWRFIYAHRDTPGWPTIFDLLAPMNQAWAGRAAALVVVVSATTAIPPGATAPMPSYSHSFDAGAAWAYLALQATKIGWHTHGIVGFDIEKAYEVLKIPTGYRVEAALAVGRQGDKNLLPPILQSREQPNGRKPLEELVMKDRFSAQP
jgi:nitroreductase